jgi:hypothetical protein
MCYKIVELRRLAFPAPTGRHLTEPKLRLQLGAGRYPLVHGVVLLSVVSTPTVEDYAALLFQQPSDVTT